MFCIYLTTFSLSSTCVCLCKFRLHCLKTYDIPWLSTTIIYQLFILSPECCDKNYHANLSINLPREHFSCVRAVSLSVSVSAAEPVYLFIITAADSWLLYFIQYIYISVMVIMLFRVTGSFLVKKNKTKLTHKLKFD